MTKTLDVCHLRAGLGSFAFFLHPIGGEINHEEHEGHGEFRFVLRTAGRLRSGERGLLARSARQLAEHKIPSASCQRLQAGSLRSPELGRAMTALFRESARCYSPSCDSYYLRL